MTLDTYSTYFTGSRWVLAVSSACMMLLLVTGCTTSDPMPQTNVVTRLPTPPITADPTNTPPSHLDIAMVEELHALAYTDGTLVARARLQQEQQQGMDDHALMLITAHIDWLEGDITSANALLTQVAASDNHAARDFARQQQQHILELERRWLAAAEVAYQRSREHMPEHSADVLEDVWSLLLRIPDDQLRQAIKASTDSEWRQWLTLSAGYRQGRQSVTTWLQLHSNHPAAHQMPGALATWLQATPPNHVAAILPLSGSLKSAGNAVLDGMITELYKRYPVADTRPSLIVIDSNLSGGISEAYREAEKQGANVVLGPLTKANVQRLGATTPRSTPVIALNRPDILLPDEVLSWSAMSLAPEDEARQLAQIAYGQGLRRAIVIAPGSDWGQRMADALRGRWRGLGGQITTELVLDDDSPLSLQISDTVGSAQAEARVKAFEDAFALPIEARPRRREDYDVIFLLTPSPAEARAIRPLLVFHYSGDVPIYAPSTVYAGDNPPQNRDLNNVRFLEIPAMLRAGNDRRFRRLNALGADAVRMLEHYEQALDTRAPLFAGETGRLQRSGNGDITRELDLVVFAEDNVQRVSLPSH